MSEWRQVRPIVLPPPGEIVLGWDRIARIYILVYWNGEYWQYLGSDVNAAQDNITHWASLPDPPESQLLPDESGSL